VKARGLAAGRAGALCGGRGVGLVAGLSGALCGGAACSVGGAGAGGAGTVAVSSAEAAADAAGGPLAALESGAGELVDLEVPRHRRAVVGVPVGARGPRPVVVAAHGAGDRPEGQCRFWREIVKERAFVLCPRGFAMNPHVPPDQTGYFYTTHHMLGEEVTAGLAALAARFGAHVDLRGPVYAGFSQGAIMGALVLPDHPARFSRAVLVEGGYGLFQEWNRLVARRFRERGGVRVLMACGRAACAVEAAVSAGYMEREGLTARVVHAPGAGHTYGGAVGEEVARAFAWVVEGDGRFGGGWGRGGERALPERRR
jgi:predicted esterase